MPQETYTTILLTEPAPGVAVVAFNRPEVANALSTKMGEELTEAWTTFAARADLRCAILTGEGRHFQAGADLKERNGMTDEAWALQHQDLLAKAAWSEPSSPCPCRSSPPSTGRRWAAAAR